MAINHGKRFTEQDKEYLLEQAKKINSKEELYELAPEIANKLGRTEISICKQIEEIKKEQEPDKAKEWFFSKK